jgi:DNA adenine methylase
MIDLEKLIDIAEQTENEDLQSDLLSLIDSHLPVDLSKPVKPLFGYYGGKQKIAGKIIKHLPPHTVYAEPFAGGAAVMFKKGLPITTSYSYYREVLNDTNQKLVNLYRVCQNKEKLELLKHLLKYTPYSLDEYIKAKDCDSSNDVIQAWAYFYLLTNSYSHDPNTGFAYGKIGENFPRNWQVNIKNVDLVFKRLANIHISNVPAIDQIKKWDSPHTCFYCDPPYINTCQGPYKGYTEEQFKALIEVLKNCKSSFALSCYPSELVPIEWKRVDFETQMSAVRYKKGINKKRTECLWVVDRSHNTRDDLQKHLWRP